jgi:spore maturation protein CgeB
VTIPEQRPINDQSYTKKILVFDGISGVPLARELCEAFEQQGVENSYVDGQSLKRKAFYGVRSKITKAINRTNKKDGFYHFPKAADAGFFELLNVEKPDVLLVVGFLYRFVSPALVEKIKNEQGFELYLYDTDSCNFYSKRREFVFFLDNELPIYDHIFSFSQVTANFFRNTRSLPSSYFPFGAKPISLPDSVDYKNDVLFVGSADLRRIFLLEKIKDKVSIFGSRWERNRALM